jgi:beta-galactosidase
MQLHYAKTFRASSRLLIATVMLGSSFSVFAQAPSAAPGTSQPTILYGAAYYNEYMPADLQPGRLEKDVALMKAAGITVVRMGESTWSLWEPSDGRFDYAWMDRVVDAMGKAGIKVIMARPPTPSPHGWRNHIPRFSLAR